MKKLQQSTVRSLLLSWKTNWSSFRLSYRVRRYRRVSRRVPLLVDVWPLCLAGVVVLDSRLLHLKWSECISMTFLMHGDCNKYSISWNNELCLVKQMDIHLVVELRPRLLRLLEGVVHLLLLFESHHCLQCRESWRETQTNDLVVCLSNISHMRDLADAAPM